MGGEGDRITIPCRSSYWVSAHLRLVQIMGFEMQDLLHATNMLQSERRDVRLVPSEDLKSLDKDDPIHPGRMAAEGQWKSYGDTKKSSTGLNQIHSSSMHLQANGYDSMTRIFDPVIRYHETRLTLVHWRQSLEPLVHCASAITWLSPKASKA